MNRRILVGMIWVALGSGTACASTMSAKAHPAGAEPGAASMEPQERPETREEAEARQHAEWVAQPWNDSLQP
jgi:hypothetical protein